jgi:hypothetical protein
VVVDPDKATDHGGLPAVVPETMIVDHGKIYLSEHLFSVCKRFGISIQPARPMAATDKATLERFYRTLGEDLLAALPGYKGPDVYSRGDSEHVEDAAYYFLDELEQILREWVAERYHQRPHHGLCEPLAPKVELTPLEMFDAGIVRAGCLRVPARPDLAYDFLDVEWRTIQHYGVEVHGLRYDGPALRRYRNCKSPYTGRHEGQWPLRYDPDDISRLYFQDPEDHSWHELRWIHASDVPVPFSGEVLAYARRLALKTQQFPDDRRALAELLERWDAGLATDGTARRMALRLSQQRKSRLAAEATRPERGDDGPQDLPTVRALFGDAEPSGAGGPAGGDDDEEEELDAAPVGDMEHFYDDALESLDG